MPGCLIAFSWVLTSVCGGKREDGPVLPKTLLNAIRSNGGNCSGEKAGGRFVIVSWGVVFILLVVEELLSDLRLSFVQRTCSFCFVLSEIFRKESANLIISGDKTIVEPKRDFFGYVAAEIGEISAEMFETV